MIDIQDHHLGGAARLAAGLDHAGESVEALHETDRAGGNAAAGKCFPAATQRRKIGAGAGAPLEQHAFGACVRSMIDSMVSLTELMKHAEHCGLACTPTSR